MKWLKITNSKIPLKCNKNKKISKNKCNKVVNKPICIRKINNYLKIQNLNNKKSCYYKLKFKTKITNSRNNSLSIKKL